MVGESSYEAVQNFLQPISLILSCITRVVPDVSGGYYVAADSHVLTLAKADRVPLQGESRLSLTLTQHYRVIEDIQPRGPWRVTTTVYQYSFDDVNGNEVISFQWHPNQRSNVKFPHVHMGYGSGVTRPELIKAHIPTGRVFPEDVIRFAISDLNVRALRADWTSILNEAQTGYDLFGTW
jgi:hypothetical protein